MLLAAPGVTGTERQRARGTRRQSNRPTSRRYAGPEILPIIAAGDGFHVRCVTGNVIETGYTGFSRNSKRKGGYRIEYPLEGLFHLACSYDNFLQDSG